MEDFKRIIEQLRREQYFLYDVIYTEVDSKGVSIEDGLSLEVDRDRNRNVPANLSRLLLDHLSNGLKLRLVKAELCFKSYKQKVPQQQDTKIDNRHGYYVEVDFEKRLAIPDGRMRESPNVKKIYEDLERIFRGCGWQFGSEEFMKEKESITKSNIVLSD